MRGRPASRAFTTRPALRRGATNRRCPVNLGDSFVGFTLKKPLRVYSGTATVDVATGIDLTGNPIVSRQTIGLAPSGSETDLGASYGLPLGDGVSASLNLTARFDADNVAGARDAGAIFRLRASF
jgi:hypothetical protein